MCNVMKTWIQPKRHTRKIEIQDLPNEDVRIKELI